METILIWILMILFWVIAFLWVFTAFFQSQDCFRRAKLHQERADLFREKYLEFQIKMANWTFTDEDYKELGRLIKIGKTPII